MSEGRAHASVVPELPPQDNRARERLQTQREGEPLELSLNVQSELDPG